jgi:hypothetical protein
MLSGSIPGNTDISHAKPKQVFARPSRARMARRGYVRVEVNVRKEDASLVRQIAAALSDPARQAEARALLRLRFAEPPEVSLKALLASAPVEGIDLDRGHDLGRDVDL